MNSNERIKKFLLLQSKNFEFEYIANEIGIKEKTLRAFLNKNGYKLKDGKYINELKNNEQIQFTNTKKDKLSASNKDINNKDKRTTKQNVKKEDKNDKKQNQNNVKENKIKKTKKVKDKKVNVTIEDIDKLCEVYDWYLQVKDYKALKPKAKEPKKDINIDVVDFKEMKSTSIKIEKNVWEEFERLCSNSKHTKQEIVTQALKDFMKEYKNLL